MSHKEYEDAILNFLWDRITSRIDAGKYGIFKTKKYSWFGVGRKTKVNWGPLDDWQTEDYISLVLSFYISYDEVVLVFSRGTTEDAKAIMKFSSAKELRDMVNNLKNNRDVAHLINLAIEFLINRTTNARNIHVPMEDSTQQNLDNSVRAEPESEPATMICSYCGMEYGGEKRCRGCGASKWKSANIILEGVNRNDTTNKNDVQREAMIENVDWGKVSGILKTIGEVTSSLSAIVRPKNEQTH